MKKIIIIAGLLLFGNIGFSLEEPQGLDTTSRYQSLVSRVFKYYNLPLPGTENFPTYGEFNLSGFNNEKPEFSVMTTPMIIKPKSLAWRVLGKYLPGEYHLRFEGKILDDGGYQLEVQETKFSNRNIQFPPAIHRFHFSSDDSFQGYHVRQEPISINEADYLEGFFCFSQFFM